MPLKPFTLAVLECDQPLDHARIDLGGHTGVWSALFADAADAQGIPRDRIKVIGYNAEEGLPTLDGSGNKDTGEERIDAVLVSGSRYNAWGDDAWIINLVEFVRECVEKKVPVIGICFGHQVVGRALGAEVGRSENGWEVAPTRLVVSEAGKGVFGKDEITLHLMNRDIVKTCPPNMEILASSSNAKIHSLYRPGAIFTVQGHPEFNGEIIKELLKMRIESGVVPEDTGNDGIGRALLPHDGLAVTIAFWKFLGI
ncbi:hypothetical protein TWF225_001031 [Orbilia oligospora]|nr:hypothetical protein TWF225_001031 [Orbilia oligospora]KAF3237858.1 hypothetical protein TWF128_000745 [Orbilia oligospora]KAF3238435.1 hypothetical protein TWF217_001710 [Orbilia oligospora]KAF3273949.1 hypothetical protein TWF132_004471 [Orbilia oligospora]